MSKEIAAITPSTSSEPPTSTGSRMAAEERKLQILRVAVSLFSQKGFGGTTTREIAQAAGVSEALLYKHFPSKESLYAAMLDACAKGPTA